MSFPSMFSVPVRDARVGDVVHGFRIVGIHQETTGNIHMLCVYADYAPLSETGYYYAICGTNGDRGENAKLWPNFYTDLPSEALKLYMVNIGVFEALPTL